MSEVRVYTTLKDLVEREVIEALGDFGDDYDIAGFVAALRRLDLIVWVPERQGFTLILDDDGLQPAFQWLLPQFDLVAAA